MKRQRQAGFLMAKIHQLAGRIFSRMLKDHGISEINPSQGRILFALWRQDGLPINELAKATSLGKSTLTSMLDRLETIDYVKRRPSKEDRRKIFIYRTEKDKSMQKQYGKVSQEITKLFYQGFTEDEMDLFEIQLQRIFDNLKNLEDAE